MTILFFLASVGFFLWVGRNILFWVYLWQLKEYRFDRLFIHLTETTQGRQLLFSKESLLKWISIFGYGLVLYNSHWLFPYQVFVTAIFGHQVLIVFRELFWGFLKRPTLTIKALFLTLLSLYAVFFFFLIPLIDRFLWLLIIDKITPLVVGFFVFFFSFPTELYRDYKIERATKKIQNRNDLLVIGVTGSYGKSSTKEYTAEILKHNFNILKTQGTNNTPIGIANTILSGLKKKTEVLVVEMGAYKKGEIAQMCAMVHPKIGILTAVNYQHLSLFGSLENTISAKYEIIESLPKDGLALFNGNNKNAYKLFKKTKIGKNGKKKILYRCIYSDSNDKEGKNSGDIVAYNIITHKTNLSFDVLLDGKVFRLTTPLIGAHNIENILPGIYIAHYLGMSEAKIKKAVSLLSPLSKTMVFHGLSNGAVVIDDTFNANPNAVIAALDYMKTYGGKRILVLQPMIELGENAQSEHYQIAKEISKVCDFLLLTNRNFYKDIKRGIEDGGRECEIKIGNAQTLSEFIHQTIGKKDIVVFEGKEASFTLERLL